MADTPAYIVNEIEVHDPERFKDYAVLVPATLEPFGGHFIVRGGESEGWAGAPPAGRTVILRFPSRDAARAWRASAAYQEALRIRDEASTSRVYVVDGVPEG